MRAFRVFAIAAAAGTYLLIFIGGLVRVAGAGLGCPDWPRCFGGWIPPTSVSQLPSYIDAAAFNFTLAWIEYGNRLVGVVLGLLILATAILALIYYRSNRKILWPSLAAALLVAFQGWLGGVVVATELKPVLVSAHLLLAFGTGLLLLYVILQTYYAQPDSRESVAVYPRNVDTWFLGLGVIALIQILLGAQVRGRLDIAETAYPLLSDFEWLATVGVFQDLHMFLGILLLPLTFFAAYAVFRLSENSSPVARKVAGLMTGLVLIQVVIGFLFLWVGLAELLRLFHLWVASLYLSTIFVLYIAVRHPRRLPDRLQRSAGKIVVILVVAAVLLAAGGLAVVREADYSRADIPDYGQIPDFQAVDTAGLPFDPERMRDHIWVLSFMHADSPEEGDPVVAAMADLYERSHTSDIVHFATIAVGPYAGDEHPLAGYPLALTVTDPDWQFVWMQDVEPARELYSLFEGAPMIDTGRFILVDASGRVRGFYVYDSKEELKLLTQHLKELLRGTA